MGPVKLDQPQLITPFLGVDGLTVWMRNTEYNMGWNFRISDSPSLESCLAPLGMYHLDFIDSIRNQRTVLPPIEDTITGREFL